MNANEKIKKYSFIIALSSIGILIYFELKNKELSSFWNNFLFSLFGSSLLSWLVARISFNSEIRRAKIEILIDLVSIHKKFRKFFDTYILKNTEPEVILMTYKDIHDSIDNVIEKYEHFKYQFGKDITSYTKTQTFTELCGCLLSINGELHDIYQLTKLKNLESNITKSQIECQNMLKDTAKLIKKAYKQEYNKDFSDINSIGL